MLTLWTLAHTRTRNFAAQDRPHVIEEPSSVISANARATRQIYRLNIISFRTQSFRFFHSQLKFGTNLDGSLCAFTYEKFAAEQLPNPVTLYVMYYLSGCSFSL